MIYVIFESDELDSYSNRVIKHMTTSKKEAIKFFTEYRKEYDSIHESYNLQVATYNNKGEDQSDGSDIIRDLQTIITTKI